ncbi:hypothetical protein PH5382_02099 [Phaeobacter sp. CECT 5382]|uniref:hypothetical protein n=1 Tax=Phaeobacter sp. CECT 5382 TaxID=1712645 RepID=UPI0006DB7EAF|nr:hypothetical protein [Phaeobacter sp. CECT 5382]CUH88167.1 hypothetical protein PH5382_02099 [Phaeobacter sp. CECT 5382]
MASVEVMRACENVCRDFSWLGKFSDWGPALLASSVALIIAFYAYPWQKERDRKLQIQLEQRGVYRDLIFPLHDVRFALENLGSFSDFADLQKRISSVFERLNAGERQFLASTVLIDPKIANEFQRYFSEARSVMSDIGDELQQLRATQDSLVPEPPVKDVKGVFKDVLDCGIRKLDAATEGVINRIRESAFGLQGEIRLQSRKNRKPEQ